MMPLALFGSRAASSALNLLTLLLYGALGGFLVLLPYLLITGVRLFGAPPPARRCCRSR